MIFLKHDTYQTCMALRDTNVRRLPAAFLGRWQTVLDFDK
jgi:hypothetical protein